MPNEVVFTLERRIAGKRTHWDSVGEYLQERIIYDVMREHTEECGYMKKVDKGVI